VAWYLVKPRDNFIFTYMAWLGLHMRQYSKCGNEVPGMISLQVSYLHTYSLLRGVTFGVLPLNSDALRPTMLPLLETFLELLLWNSFQCCHFFWLYVFSILVFSSL